jgi:DNA-binding MarR family transcriptional regulator
VTNVAREPGAQNDHAVVLHEFFTFWYESLRAPGRRRPTEDVTSLPQSAMFIMHRLKFRGPLSVSDLGRSFGLDRSTISRQLEPLRAERLVDEAPHPQNRRITLISVSARGQRLLDKVSGAHVDYWSAVLAKLSEQEQDQLAVLLGRLRCAIESQAGA